MTSALHNRDQSRRYGKLKSDLEEKLMELLLEGTVVVGDEIYKNLSDAIERANELSCQYDELYTSNT